MRVLLLPVNIASDISHKVRSLRKIGVDARGFSVAESAIQTADDVRFFSLDYSAGKIAKLRRMKVFAEMWRLIAWADVLHWIADANVFAEKWNYKFLRWINKPGVVQWMGSDIRVPEIDFPENPFYQRAFEDGYEYAQTESAAISRANQLFAAGLDFYPLEFVGLGQFIDSQLFPKRFKTWQSIVLSEHEPRFPDTAKHKPLVIHSPSAPVAKGTKYVLQAVENLKSKYDFDFKFVQNLERREALKIMSECDVYVDQLILGAHGYAAVEAMAFGKPVVCYINPVAGKDYPADLPIVNSNPDNIEEKLENLITDAQLRHETGRKSREYVEKYHDDRKIARELTEIYKEVLDLHKKRGKK
jgi:glycosyltransferase involved in cell wall biosynthesis